MPILAAFLFKHSSKSSLLYLDPQSIMWSFHLSTSIYAMQLTNLYLALSAVSLGTAFAVPATISISTITAWTSTIILPGWTSTSTFSVSPSPAAASLPAYPAKLFLVASSSGTTADGTFLQNTGAALKYRAGFGIDETAATIWSLNATTGNLFSQSSTGRRQLAVTSGDSSFVRALPPGVGAPLKCSLNAKGNLDCHAKVVCTELRSKDDCVDGTVKHLGVQSFNGFLALIASSYKIAGLQGVDTFVLQAIQLS